MRKEDKRRYIIKFIGVCLIGGVGNSMDFVVLCYIILRVRELDCLID